VLYLVDGLGYARADALQLYGLYTGLVYLTPILGGWMADRYLGKRRAALIGGLTMMLGHLAMAVDGLLQLALGLLIVGNGFFKANTTAMVGELYDGPDDPRRNGGYTLFYMGINLGAFLAPLVAGSLGHWLGWHWGFGVAALGMAAGNSPGGKMKPLPGSNATTPLTLALLMAVSQPGPPPCECVKRMAGPVLVKSAAIASAITLAS